MNSNAAGAPGATSSSYCYDLFGLSFELGEMIPGLVPAAVRGDATSIQVRFGHVPVAIRNPEFEDEQVQATASEYLFTYPAVMRMHVARGNTIVVEKLEQCDPVRLWTLVLGMGSSIAGFQRGFVPLHASGIKFGEGCIALAGLSGAGKSTAAASLVDLGFALHADDLCLIQLMRDGGLVGGGVRELRLWDDAFQSLDWPDRTPFAAVPEVAKSIYRLPAQAPSPAPLPLRRIYELGFADESLAPGIHRVEGVAALETIIRCLRMRAGLLAIGGRQLAFENVTRISREIEIYRFVRPRNPSLIKASAKQLVAHFSS